jgi:glycosyltransferase involved in cell wall biosynthesis
VRAAAGASGADIRLTGTLSDAGIARELARHDALVLPSRYEGFGIAVGEALSHGLAVIASHAGALPEVVGDGDGRTSAGSGAAAAALLVPSGDRRALMRALARLARERGLLQEMQGRALQRARLLPRWAETQEAFAAATLSWG